jgi:hypothetical protein
MNEQDKADITPESDEVEGHGIRGRGLTADEDTEGHAARSGHVEGADEDTEGHAARSGHVEGPDDDTEGHGVRVRL